MSSPRVSSLDEAEKVIKTKSTTALRELLLEEGCDPLIAFVLINKIGRRMWLSREKFNWTDHSGEIVEVPLLLRAIEAATSGYSYEETINFFLKHSNNQIGEHIGKLLLTRIQDNDFKNKLQSDNVMAPILFDINPDLEKINELKEFKKELSEQSKYYLKKDVLFHLGFSEREEELSDDQKDILAINMLLRDRNKMLKELDKLENALKEKIRESNPKVNFPLPKVTERNYYFFNKPYNQKSFLFNFFKDFIEKNEFKELIRLMDVKSDEDFIRNLKERKLFKDPAIGGMYHGAWTHLIQWYCIVSAYLSKELPLTKSPAEIYQSIGDNADKDNTIWDLTFETPKASMPSKYDFRNVVDFQDFINKDELSADRFPTLHTMIYYRALKDEDKKQQLKK